jgi:AraC-like DNA-binding protein
MAQCIGRSGKTPFISLPNDEVVCFSNHNSSSQLKTAPHFYAALLFCSCNFKQQSKQMKIYIKNMVCNRCILVVQQLLQQLQIPYLNVQMGEVELVADIPEKTLAKLSEALQTVRFSLIDDRKSRIIEQVKNAVIKMVHHDEELPRQNFSDHLSSLLHYDYKYLSHLFSDVEGTTIEQYIIRQKIERAKELLVYDELTLSEIADKMGYSSVAHLSNQFKKVTGLTPSHFRQIRENKRHPLDEV